MNKLDSQLQAPTFLADPSSRSIDKDCRLIILIPADSEFTTATRPVWELANTLGASVQLVSLCNDATQEPSIRRGLVTMASLLKHGSITTQWKVEWGTNWVGAVKQNYQAGDTIVCFAEQRAGFLQRPLSQILKSDLNAPIYILSNPASQTQSQSGWLSQLIIWSGSLGIIVGSFLLQTRIALLPQDWAQTTLMILSVIGEIWLIWVWNTLFS